MNNRGAPLTLGVYMAVNGGRYCRQFVPTICNDDELMTSAAFNPVIPGSLNSPESLPRSFHSDAHHSVLGGFDKAKILLQ